MRPRMVLLTSLFVVLTAAPRPARAVPLLTGFGGDLGYGVNRLPENDDGSSAAIDLTVAFPGGLNFFGGPYTTFYVNNNGNITFRGPVPTYTPEPFPIASQPMIAPYWGDVDTRGGYSRTGTVPGSATPGRNGVFWHLEPGLLVVTWHNVGYYSRHDDRVMDFQLILRNALDCRSGDFDVEFRFQACQWETGDASGGSGGFGGTPAQAGFDAGNGMDFVEIMGSRMAGISTRMCNESNVGEPGVWRFGVRGGAVSCPGTGEPCDTGMPGACGVGITQCVGREVVCTGIGTPTPERCDGVDNDCDGMVDDGDGLCPALELCVAGECVPPCFEGGCSAGETCTESGVCVETACIGVSCPSGQRCSGGACVGACDGIVCPHGRQCVAGRCIDLCDVLTCPAGEICVDGACVATCPCRSCGPDAICGADGACIPLGCDIVICEPGFYCERGECLDACAGAVCPEGQHCERGECVEGDPPPPDGGPPPAPDGGPGVEQDAGAPETDAGVVAVEDAGADGGRGPGPRRRGGCGCRLVDRGPAPHVSLAIAALGLLLALRRRRR